MSMALSLLFAFSLFIHSTYSFDITQILNQYPEYTSFNTYLTQTNLAAAINARQTITVLVVDNGAFSSISSTSSPDTIKNILSVHIILDYYDVAKLQQLTSSSTLLTTLFQSTGLAKGQQGFLMATHPNAGTTVLGSAMPGSIQGSSFLVKSVMSEPYNISVIQISNPIIPQGIDGSKTSSPPSTTPTATPPTPAISASPPLTTTTATPPPPATTTSAPSTTPTATPPSATTVSPPTTATTPPPAAATPTSTVTSSAPSNPTMAPVSIPPTTATTPINAVAATPSATPSSAPSGVASVDVPATEEPAGTTPAAEKPAGKSSATMVEMGLVVVCTTALSSLYLTSRI